MKRTLSSLAVAFALVVAPSAAFADDTTQLDGGCEFQASATCMATCTGADFSIQCAGDVEANCRAMLPTECTASASIMCDASCEGSCEGSCSGMPPSFSCTGDCEARAEGECSASVDAECTSECMSNADMASCKADCKAKITGRCSGSVNARCQAECTGTKGTVDCKGSCSASCSGSCDAKAEVHCNGYLKCNASANVDCEANLKVMCSGSCSGSGGLLVCNGKVVSFQSTLDDAKAWIQAHGYAHGEASSSCSGNTCQAEASGEAGTKCSTTPNPGNGSMLTAGIVGLAFAASRLRRKQR